MSMKNASQDTSATPTKESPTCPERDGRKTTQDDSGTDSDKETANPPHGHVSHGRAAFLHWIGRRRDEIDGFDPSLDELSELYDKWRQQHEQADLGRWSQ